MPSDFAGLGERILLQVFHVGDVSPEVRAATLTEAFTSAKIEAKAVVQTKGGKSAIAIKATSQAWLDLANAFLSDMRKCLLIGEFHAEAAGIAAVVGRYARKRKPKESI